ncbi:MAG: hypothetical protein H7Y13_09020 [Sphingobacteriaceae bacterium]|nr:hypothetical protein [Sphingobacteriaceae bacterium]
MTDDPSYRKLYETSNWTVGYIYEYAYLTDKSNGTTILLGGFIYDPTCALISDENLWCVVGGDKLLIWAPNEAYEIVDDNLKNIGALRQVDSNTIHILTDPWSENSAIWEFSIRTRQRRKLRDFNDYKDKEYTEDIKW